jgi:hypothetical protein
LSTRVDTSACSLAWIPHNLSVASVIAESLERGVKKLEAENGGKRFPRRGSELPKSPVKGKKMSG